MDVREKHSSKNRLIDANALLRHKRKMSGADFGGEFWDEAVLASDIKNAPTVDAVEVVRHGRWVKHGRKWQCTNCKVLMSIDGTPKENLLNYCPNCGAKMDGGAE